MTAFSVITLVRNREQQLRNMLESIAASHLLPHEVVVVRMESKRTAIDEDFPTLAIKEVVIVEERLPLAKARNMGAFYASGETLVFVDVDCICSPSLFTNLIGHNVAGGVSSASVKYLPQLPSHGRYDELASSAISHPKRDAIATNKPVDHKKFWSLVFAIKQQDFWMLNGFDEKFTGYGGEDTDFAERFNQGGMVLEFIDDFVLHQYHPKYNPPLNHVAEICANANYFKQKHGYFPMYTWLIQFCDQGYLEFDAAKERFHLVKPPTKDDLARARSTLPY